MQRNLKCVKAEHNLLRGAFLSSKLCSFAVKDGRGDTREKAEQRRTRCLILEKDSNLRLTVQRFSGPSCQKAINISFDHFGSGVERKEGVLKSVLYNFQRYKLSSVVIEKILENIQRF